MTEILFVALTILALVPILLTWNNNEFGGLGIVGCVLLIGLGISLMGIGIDQVSAFITVGGTTTIDYGSWSGLTDIFALGLSWVYIIIGLGLGFIIGINLINNHLASKEDDY